MNPVNIALGICTFKREPFIRRNIRRLIQDILENKESPLCGHLQVFIADNGRTLLDDLFEENRNIHIYPNRNVGGAGGFTRTMIEAIIRRKGEFSHMLLTDDDIILPADTLERTYIFLRMLKPEYRNDILGGAMFSLEERSVQLENAANVTSSKQTIFNRFMDFNNPDAVAVNELEKDANYCAWIYCCFPASMIRPESLPVPLFIHYDDIEYGIRNSGGEIITLNGICVWHPNPLTKSSDWALYYDIRNQLITINSTDHPITKKDALLFAAYNVAIALTHYNYEKATLVNRALRDYCAGPEAFMAMDPVENHSHVFIRHDMISPEKLGLDVSSPFQLPMVYSKMKEYGTDLLCLLIPASRKIKVVADGQRWEPFTARTVYVYNQDKKKGYLAKRSRIKMIKISLEFLRTAFVFACRYDKLKEEWKAAKSSYTNLKFWEKYLRLDA